MVNAIHHDVAGEHRGYSYIADYTRDDDTLTWQWEIYDPDGKNITDYVSPDEIKACLRRQRGSLGDIYITLQRAIDEFIELKNTPFPQFTPKEQELLNIIVENIRNEFLKQAHKHQDNEKYDRAERAFQKTHELDQIMLKLNDIFERQES